MLDALSSFYYDSARPPAQARVPRLGTPFFRLQFSNGYITGIVAATRLDRFLSYGVNLGQFQANVWYRIPTRAVAGLRRLTVGLTPLRLDGAALAGAPTFSVQSPDGTRPSSRTRRPATSSARRDSLRWPLGLVPLAGLIALALLARRRRRSKAPRLPTGSVR